MRLFEWTSLLFLATSTFVDRGGATPCVKASSIEKGIIDATIQATCTTWQWNYEYGRSGGHGVFGQFRTKGLAENDYCEAYEGTDISGQYIGRLTDDGTSTGPVVSYASTHIFFYCKTNETTEDVKISADGMYQQRCGATPITTLPVTVSSPNYPRDYPQNFVCIWEFTADEPGPLVFNFHRFSLETNYDFVYIITDNDTTPNYKQSGILDRFQLETYGSSFRMYMTSDVSFFSSGFIVRIGRSPLVVCLPNLSSGGSGGSLIVDPECEVLEWGYTHTGASAVYARIIGEFSDEDSCTVYQGSSRDGQILGVIAGDGVPVISHNSTSFYFYCLLNLTESIRIEVSEVSDGCRYHQYQCPDFNICVPTSSECDGVNDCPGDMDEMNCGGPCEANSFSCGNGACIPDHYRCDGVDDCDDDESNCGILPTSCSVHEFECQGLCIPIHNVCNRRIECPNFEDEAVCSDTCANDEFQCMSGDCIPIELFCDGYHDCFDFSDDEGNCQIPNCPSHLFACPGTECEFSIDRMCDSFEDCTLGLDEFPCDGNCTDDEFTCESGACIPIEFECNRRIDCAGGDDETDCINSGGCRFVEFECPGNRECIPYTQVCDGMNHCQGGEDESTCGDPCEENEFGCGNGACIPEILRCDYSDECDTDEDGCEPPIDPSACSSCQFSCGPYECIPVYEVCDGVKNCLNAIDEAVCNDTCTADEFKCKSGYCLPPDLRCNDIHDCFDYDDDEANCQDFVANCSAVGIVGSLSGSYVRNLFSNVGYQLQLASDDLQPLVDCFAVKNNNSDRYEMVFTGGHEKCSANVNESDTEIVVTYKILLFRPSTSLIIRNDHQSIITFQCSFSSTEVVSLGHPLMVLISHAVFDMGKTASSFVLEMARYTSDTFTTMESQRTITIGSPVYIGVKINVQVEANVVLQGISCYIKPSQNESVLIYPIVEEGCVVEDPLSAEGNVIYNLTDPRVFGISFLGFGWPAIENAEQELWISCNMNICETNDDNDCQIDCGNEIPAKRSVVDETDERKKNILLGPFNIVVDKTVNSNILCCDKNTVGCSHKCVIDTNGNPLCVCPGGFFLDGDEKTCLEVSETVEKLRKVSFNMFLFLGVMMMSALIMAIAIRKA